MNELLNFENLTELLEQYAVEVRNLYQDKLRAEDRVASGELLNNVECRVETNGSSYMVILNLAEYWKYIEYGTSPHWPPPRAILNWIRIKPVVPTPDKNGKIPSPESLAFLIGRKIANFGTAGTPCLEEATKEMNEKYYSMMKEALSKDIHNSLAAFMAGVFKGD